MIGYCRLPKKKTYSKRRSEDEKITLNDMRSWRREHEENRYFHFMANDRHRVLDMVVRIDLSQVYSYAY